MNDKELVFICNVGDLERMRGESKRNREKRTAEKNEFAVGRELI